MYFGSQIFNIFLIIGLSSIITPIKYEVSYNFDMIMLLAASVLFAVFPLVGKKDKMTAAEGCLFLATYMYYIMHLILA